MASTLDRLLDWENWHWESGRTETSYHWDQEEPPHLDEARQELEALRKENAKLEKDLELWNDAADDWAGPIQHWQKQIAALKETLEQIKSLAEKALKDNW